MNVVSLEISGNDKQETREGYNILKVTRDNFTENGVTFTNNQDGSFTLNGTSTTLFYIDLNNSAGNRFTLTQNKKYFLYFAESSKQGISLTARISETTSGITVSTKGIRDWVNATSDNGFAFMTITKGTTFNNETFYPMVAESDVEVPYEAYGAMPSPSYPSEVETVNTQASVVVSNKNVFSFEKAEKLATYAMPFYEVIDNNSIELKNSADWAYIQYQYILKKDTQYTISFDLEFEGADNVTQWWTTIEDSLGSIATDFVTLVNNKYIKTFTTREDMIVKIKLFASTPINPALTIIKNIQIEEGNTATEYVPFSVQTKVVDIQQEMLEGDYFVKEEDGWKEVHLWNKQVLDGTQNVTYFDAPSKEIADSLDTTYFSVYLDKSGENDKTKKNNIKSNYFKNLYAGDEIWGNVSTDNSYLKESIALQESLRLRIRKERLTGYTNDLTNTEKVTLLNNYLQQQYNSGNPVCVWYKLATPTKLTCTEKQVQQLEDLLNTSTYKNITHIYSTDKVSPVIKIKYRKDITTLLNNQQSEYETRLSNIEKLLTTTTTSALLLDNLQTDLEKEVI